jgi:hypothetical protein
VNPDGLKEDEVAKCSQVAQEIEGKMKRVERRVGAGNNHLTELMRTVWVLDLTGSV